MYLRNRAMSAVSRSYRSKSKLRARRLDCCHVEKSRCTATPHNVSAMLSVKCLYLAPLAQRHPRSRHLSMRCEGLLQAYAGPS